MLNKKMISHFTGTRGGGEKNNKQEGFFCRNIYI